MPLTDRFAITSLLILLTSAACSKGFRNTAVRSNNGTSDAKPEIICVTATADRLPTGASLSLEDEGKTETFCGTAAEIEKAMGGPSIATAPPVTPPKLILRAQYDCENQKTNPKYLPLKTQRLDFDFIDAKSQSRVSSKNWEGGRPLTSLFQADATNQNPLITDSITLSCADQSMNFELSLHSDDDRFAPSGKFSLDCSDVNSKRSGLDPYKSYGLNYLVSVSCPADPDSTELKIDAITYTGVTWSEAKP